MGFKDFVKKQIKKMTKFGWINGADFPIGTYINVISESGEKAFLLTYPNNKEEKVTHDMIRCATVLAMGVIDIHQGSGRTPTELIYGTKYLCVFEDGRQGVLTSGIGKTQSMIESVIF